MPQHCKNKKIQWCILYFAFIITMASLIYTLSAFAQQGRRTSTGNPILDSQIIQELNLLKSVYNVNPSFFIFDDQGMPNAYASPNGTVLFGSTLMINEFNEEFGPTGNYSVIGIMAHEFAHILQFSQGLHYQLPTKILELHADFIAGWYLGNREMVLLTDAEQAMRSFYRNGDYEFNNPNHHGTPSERVRSYKTGTTTRGMNIYQAFQLGLNFVTANFHAKGSVVGKSKGEFGCILTAKIDSRTIKSNTNHDSIEIDNIDEFLINEKSNSKKRESKNKEDFNIEDIDVFLTGTSTKNNKSNNQKKGKIDKELEDFLNK